VRKNTGLAGAYDGRLKQLLRMVERRSGQARRKLGKGLLESSQIVTEELGLPMIKSTCS
jgi:hypothetical protein